MRVTDIQCRRDGAESHASAVFEAMGRRWRVQHRWNGPPSPAVADSYAILGLLPAMRIGQDLRVEGAVSERLLSALPAIQDIYLSWDIGLRRARILPATTHQGHFDSDQRGTASTFSLGVDSFHTLHRQGGRVDTLLFAPMFDNRTPHPPLQEAMSRRVARVAERSDRRMLQMHSDLRDFLDSFVPWLYTYGAALTSFGLLIAPTVSRLVLSGAYSLQGSRGLADGSLPELDPLLSTEDLTIEHQADEVTRFGKIKDLVDDPLVRENLRVCWSNFELACGQCAKCLRTMASLTILGRLDEFPDFPQPLDLEALSRVPSAAGSARLFAEENLAAARENQASPELIAALERSLRQKRHRGLGMRLHEVRLWLEERRRDGWRWRFSGRDG